MKKSWFYRMLFSYMPVFLAVCLTLLLILFFTVRQLSSRSSLQSNETVAANASQVLEQALRSIDDGMFLLVDNDPDVAGFYADSYPGAGGAGDYVKGYRAALALKSMQTRFPLLRTVYLVRPEADMVLESTGFSNLTHYPDRAYIETAMAATARYRWGDYRTVATLETGGRQAAVVSIARIANMRVKGLLVAQIDTAALQRLLRQYVDYATGFISVADAAGTTIVSTVESDEAGKSRKTFARAPMAYTGWTVESGVLQPGLLSWAAAVLYISISLGGFCSLLGLAWFVLATRRHYRPVQHLLRQIGSFPLKKPIEPEPAGRSDEFRTIGLALHHLWDRSEQLKQENEENVRFRKEHHFRRLAEGRFDAASFYGEREDELFGLPLADGRPTAVRIEIDRFVATVGAIGSGDERNRLLAGFQAAAEGMLTEAGYSFTSGWLSERQLGAIVLLQETADADAALIAVLERLRDWTERHGPFTVTIAAGVPVDRIEAVSVSFRTAAEALSFKMSLGSNRIIPLDALPGVGDAELIRELKRIEEISRLLRMGETEWEQELSLLLEALSTRPIVRDQVRNLLNVFLFHVQHKMSDLPAELGGMWREANGRLMSGLKEGESVTELAAVLQEELGAVSEQIRLWRDSRNNRGVLQEVKRYIDRHYADPNLSQAMLSETFRLHPSAISRLFKEEYGVKFVDYVNTIRVEQAVRLMEREDLPVHVVAERMGFVHSKTFIQAFKKITGTTPGTYRGSLKS